MKNVVLTLQVVIAVFLTAAILLQAKGTGLGSAFGGAGEMYRTKRGFEKLLFTATIVLASLFVLTSLINVILG